ncbi:hypothetical protein L9F63_016225 [Diploptera punctata]|uniref:EamA domain-containing protein n=1 Tax=Diploptera punctata TaxID=6984 RepID=A0AAD8A1E1_DIPPU|nr:hypothetical protein L9F63_016225 [Diploptera punctata]
MSLSRNNRTLQFLQGGFIHAINGGLCAAASSLCGKLSGIQDSSILMGLTLKILLLVSMLVFNVGVWTCFVKALQNSSSSLQATVSSTAVNYIFSALLGLVVFGETTSLQWWCGASLILIGLIFISRPTKQHEQ